MDTQEKHTGKRRIFDIIQLGTQPDLISRGFDYSLVAMIMINLLILVIDTFDPAVHYQAVLDAVESVTVVFFVIEYVLRLWTAEYLYPGKSVPMAALHFAFSFYGLIDLLSILPYLLPFFFPTGFVAFRILRVFRVFRLFRVNAQYDAFNVVVDVLRNKRQQLFSSICIILIMMLASSICMYSLEHEAQPDVFKNAFSGIWWAVSTLLTVGYGDIYPVTPAGQFMAIVISFLGVGLVAIPTGIISAGFVEQYTNMRTFSEISDGNDIKFIMLTLEDDHPWVGSHIFEIALPPELIIVTIIRDTNIVIPKGNIKFKVNDKVVLGALEFKDDIGIELHEFEVTASHPWKDQFIKDLNISKNTVIVSVYRHEKAMIPRGNMQIHLGDLITVCDKH